MNDQLMKLNFIVALKPSKVAGRETGSKTAARWLSLNPFGAALALMGDTGDTI